jgi:Tfp pilus assembly protein PilO
MRLQFGPRAIAVITTLLLMLALVVASAWAWREAHADQEERLRQARLQFIVDEIKDALDASLRLGVSLPNLSQAQPLLESVFQRHTDIVSIDIAGVGGQIIFSSDESGIGAHVPKALLDACEAVASAGNTAQAMGGSGQTRWRCAPVVNGISEVVGVLVLRHGQLALASAKDEARTILPWLAGAALLAIALALAAGQQLAGANTQLNGLVAEAQALQSLGVNGAPGAAALVALHQQLDQAESQIDAMDSADVG